MGKFSFVTNVDNFSLMFQNKIPGLTESFWSYETNVFLQRMDFTPSSMCLSERTTGKRTSKVYMVYSAMCGSLSSEFMHTGL